MENTTSLPEALKSRITSEIADNAVVLFMKGTAATPQCGFSARASFILQKLGVPFHDINVLEDDDIREGIKVYSNWPTIPQLYVKGEFIGGADIMTEMYQSGELHQLFGLPVPTATE